ncbi:hypothetical protein CBM2608_A220045 [Cupriavidus taiwanensis]|nr:hypothetical protein CBM2588_A160040 [Cupriavidus taiwanensis]SOZ23173.1 hypothetical protein CBM2608_A220045 [Cupriavidus taiwanensis]
MVASGCDGFRFCLREAELTGNQAREESVAQGCKRVSLILILADSPM